MDLRVELSDLIEDLVHRRGLINTFSRPRGGERWDAIVARSIDEASCVLLLVGPAFLASRSCMDHDLPRILARPPPSVVPVLVRGCELAGTPLAGVPMLPLRGGSIADCADVVDAWREVAREIARPVGAVHARTVLGTHGLGGDWQEWPPPGEAHVRLERGAHVLDPALDRAGSGARWLLVNAAPFAPSAVPLEWLLPSREHDPECAPMWSALGDLERMRLVTVDRAAGTLSMHPALRDRARDLTSPEAWPEIVGGSVATVRGWLAQAGPDQVYARLPHVRALVAVIRELGDRRSAADLYERAADHFRTRGAHPGTPAWYESEMAAAERFLGPEDRTLRSALVDVALVAARAGEEETARALMERSIAVSAERCGPEHPILAQPLAILAAMDDKAGRPDLALPLMERAVRVYLSWLGPADLQVAHGLFSLAKLCRTLGRPDEALAHAERAVAVLERAGGRADFYPAVMPGKLAELRKELAAERRGQLPDPLDRA